MGVRIRQKDDKWAVLAGKIEVWSVVFATATGQPREPQRLFHVHKRACSLAELRANRVHDLRHSFAIIHLYELGTPMQYVSEQLGHSSIKITVDIYGHARQGTNTYLADKLDMPAQQSATQLQLDVHFVCSAPVPSWEGRAGARRQKSRWSVAFPGKTHKDWQCIDATDI